MIVLESFLPIKLIFWHIIYVANFKIILLCDHLWNSETEFLWKKTYEIIYILKFSSETRISETLIIHFGTQVSITRHPKLVTKQNYFRTNHITNMFGKLA